ncbi:scavenger receptor class B member 1 isoform X2 [Condylostylus longicornis]|uniref:scavenger receptor class B member 1 isoform X2 n=1 Tax=Condylostylus longicornis TaxID=2530218 RepID=UPI00244E38E0|nr:scavenger receptor class B member 1 isoform X2 [Condylostylus longicornis]
MGLHKQYLRYGQTARNHLFGVNSRNCGSDGSIGVGKTNCKKKKKRNNRPTVKRNVRGERDGVNIRPTPISMLISQGTKINNTRLAVIVIGTITLILGIILSSIPWLDYFILKNLRLWNNTLSFRYWQRPGVIRLTRVYLFNVTNPDGFLFGEKPKVEEVGPFVYREDMEKVNVNFYDNLTVSYQHKKILQFVPELSIDKNTKTLTSQSNDLNYILAKTLSVILAAAKFKSFVTVTADQLVFGYDDPLVTLAHRFYPRHRRPMSQMGLLIGRNGTLTEISTINTGFTGMEEFGYLNRLNGLDYIPHWKGTPCGSINGSEGSFFPPRDITKSDLVHIYDKDLCRVIPLKYQKDVNKDGISAALYELPENVYGDSKNNPDNQCFDEESYEPVKGLQNISPCHFGAPVYISNPHFYQSDPSLLESVEGLKPNKVKHRTFFKIQPKLGVPLEGKVRIQLNLKVDKAKYISSVQNFRNFIFPIMWLEEGISELTPSIWRWIYLGTVFAPNCVPIVSYITILVGIFMIIFMFVYTFKNYVFVQDPTLELIEIGRRSLRRGSSFIIHQQHKFMLHKECYTLLKPSQSDNVTSTENIQNILLDSST